MGIEDKLEFLAYEYHDTDVIRRIPDGKQIFIGTQDGQRQLAMDVTCSLHELANRACGLHMEAMKYERTRTLQLIAELRRYWEGIEAIESEGAIAALDELKRRLEEK